MRQSRDVQFPANHPAAKGHFPGNPIIPGAFLLDEVIKEVIGDGGTVMIQSAKFFRPVRPGESIILRWETRRGEIVFECVMAEDGSLAAAGVLGIGSDDR
jgi:3-hydroxyacyl-[acyl-carrier-protein] dehydratase